MKIPGRKLYIRYLIFLFAGQLLTGAAAISQTISKTFTTSGTFNVPSGVTSITIETWGGGGAGGGADGSIFSQKGGGGGGGGGYNKITGYNVSQGSYSITVGKGGSASPGNDGGNGGNSYFGTNVCVATGGTGGKANNGAGGSGGAGSYIGGSGKNGSSSSSGGGGTSAGTLGNGKSATSSSGASGVTDAGNGGDGAGTFGGNGKGGSDPGGGGGGAVVFISGTFSGGAGGDGMVIVSYTVDPCATLYWAGQNSSTPGGTSGTDFNTSANWSIYPDSYVTAGFAPGSCNDVVINLELTSAKPVTTISFTSTSTTIKSLTFAVKNISSNSSNSIFEGGLRLGNQSLTITGDINLYSENKISGRTTQLSMDCTNDNSLFVYGGDLTTDAVNSSGSGESIVYPFSNPVGTKGKGKFVLKGNATLQGVGDDANPELNKPATIVFDGAGTQVIANNNTNSYPVYLAYNTVVGESKTPTVIFTGSNPLGFKSINNFSINSGAGVEVDASQSIDRFGAGTPGTFTMKANATLLLKGNNFPSGYNTAYTLDATSTVEYGAADGVSQTIAAVSYGNLKLSNASSSGNSNKTLTANASVKGNVIIDSCVTFDQRSYSCNRTASGGSFSLAGNAIHKLAGTYPSNFTTVSLNAGSTTQYNGASAQNVASVNYGHLILSNAGTKTAVGNTGIAGNLSILDIAVFAGGSFNHTLKGDWINNSTFSEGTSTVTFSGGTAQTIGGATKTVFNNFTVLKTNNTDIVNNPDKAFNARNLTVTKGNLVLQAIDDPYNIAGNLVVSTNGTLTHASPWDPYNKALTIYGNLDITGIFNPTVRSHVAMAGAGNKTIRTGDNPASTLSILTFNTGDYVANGKVKTNQEVWAMFGAGGSFSTAGNDVTFAQLLNYTGVININGGTLKVLGDAWVGYYGVPGRINISDGNFIVEGSLFNQPAGTIKATNAPQINIKGDWVNDGSFDPGTSTTKFYGSVDETISGSSELLFYNLMVSGTNVIQSMNIGIKNNLTIGSGIFDMQTFTCNRTAAGGVMILEPGCTVKLRAGSGGTPGSNFPANFTTYALQNGSTVSYSGTVAQKIFATPSYSNLTLSNPGVKTAESDLTIRGTLTMKNDNIFDGGTYHHKIGGDWINDASGNAFISNGGAITFNGTTPQLIGGSFGTSFNALVMDNNAGLTIAPLTPVAVLESLSATGPGKTLNTNDNLTLKSTAAKTAWVGNMTGNTINGKAVVERFVSAKKGWRFISIPTNTLQTVKQAWQEGAVVGNADPAPGYGTQITGEKSNWQAAGFDQQSYAPSMKYYNASTDTWTGIATTNATQINNTKGYMVFVRGDRLSTAVTSPETQTNLRTNGVLKTGTQPVINVLAGKYESIGNPYPSPVDFTRITKGSGVANLFYLWDPYLAGTYNLGGYQTFSATNGWVPVPGGTTAHPSGVSGTTIQNGEAFFVRGNVNASPSDLTVQFTESAKVGSNPPNFARPVEQTGAEKRWFLRTSLLNAAGLLVDGNAVVFDEVFNNDVDGDDALKFLNSGENLGLKRNGKSLSIEARSLVTANDTVFFAMSNLSKQNYTLQVVPVNFDGGAVTANVIDNYKKTSIPVPLSDTFNLPFVVNNEAASYASGRFKIVLSPSVALPVSFISLTAIQNRNDVLVHWAVAAEMHVKSYEVQRSADGIQFSALGSQQYNASRGGQYEWTDEQPLQGWNFYRIKTIDVDGAIQISPVAKVNNHQVTGSLNVYPNPLNGDKLYVHFVNQQKGDYKVTILNSAGQQISAVSTMVSGSDHVLTIDWNKHLPHGIYTIRITGNGSEVTVRSVKY